MQAGDLRKPAVDGFIARVRALPDAPGQQLSALGGSDHRDFAQGRSRAFHQTPERGGEAFSQPFGPLPRETAGVIGQDEFPLRAPVELQSQGQLCPRLEGRLAIDPTGIIVPQTIRQLVTLKADQALEKRLVRGKTRRLSHQGDRGMFMGTHGHPEIAKDLQQVGHRHTGIHPDPDRDRVDHDRDHFARLRDRAMPAGPGRTEDHFLAARLAPEDDRPGRLHEGIGGDTGGPCKGFKLLAEPMTEPCPEGPTVGAPDRFFTRGRKPERQRLLHPGQLRTPERLVRLRVTFRHPVEKAFAGDRCRQLRGTAGNEGLVDLGDFAESKVAATAIEESVVGGPDELVLGRSKGKPGKPHERRLIDSKSRSLIRIQKVPQGSILIRGIQTRQILLPERETCGRRDPDLRATLRRQVKARAKPGMALQDKLKSLPPVLAAGGLVQPDSELLHVIARLGLTQRGEDHRHLHGGRPQDSFGDRALTAGTVCQLTVHQCWVWALRPGT